MHHIKKQNVERVKLYYPTENSDGHEICRMKQVLNETIDDTSIKNNNLSTV
jgi:hypothetical protein